MSTKKQLRHSSCSSPCAARDTNPLPNRELNNIHIARHGRTPYFSSSCKSPSRPWPRPRRARLRCYFLEMVPLLCELVLRIGLKITSRPTLGSTPERGSCFQTDACIAFLIRLRATPALSALRVFAARVFVRLIAPGSFRWQRASNNLDSFCDGLDCLPDGTKKTTQPASRLGVPGHRLMFRSTEF
jgi:hypothetical protein